MSTTHGHKRARKFDAEDHSAGSGSPPSLPSPSSGGFVEVNVGGKIHSFLSSVVPESSPLAAMLSDRWRHACARDGEGRIFVDRDGDIFGDILRYLRTGSSSCCRDELSSMDVPSLRRLRVEADYFGLDDLVEEIDALRPGLVEVPVLLQSNAWARIAPRRVQLNGDRGWRLHWTNHSGNASILCPCPINDSTYRDQRREMIVGESGTYVLFLRVHMALPDIWKGDSSDMYVEVKVSPRDIAVMRNPYDIGSNKEGETLVRCGAFDSRRDDGVGPMIYATVTCAEVVTLIEGDRLWIYHPHEESFRNQYLPQPADMPAELLNSLTLIKVNGNALARYEREKLPVRKSEAYWKESTNDLPPTPFALELSSSGDVFTAPRNGSYVILGSAASSMYDESTAYQRGRSNSVQLQIRSNGKRLLHAICAFSDDTDEEHWEYFGSSSAPKYGLLNDVVYMKAGFTLTVRTRGALAIGATDLDHDLRPQHLAVALLSPSQQQNRFQIMNNSEDNQLIWLRSFCPYETEQPSFFERRKDEDGIDESVIVMTESQGTFLAIGSFPPLDVFTELVLAVNNEPVAISKAPETYDELHCNRHHFHEILQLKKGDQVSVGIFPTEQEIYDQPRSLDLGPMYDRVPVFCSDRGYMNFLKLDGC